MTDPLQLPLKDIHLPQELPWWPPAPGWWCLLALLVLTIVAIGWWRRRQQRAKRSAINMAKQELLALQDAYDKHQDPRQFVADLSILLRRLSISAFPRTETASLTGEAWLNFLDRPLQKETFSNGPGRMLIEAPYRPEVKAAELQPLVEVCRQWIDSLAERKEERQA